ncbi:tetratricopeptide repeat protein [Candidatus Babela massiliensis]|uniref:TPR repeats containing protein n=1 Tax=Candidatus Babela massiliensis TaxID=673862 RepID=V6DK14_9BACT|nr:tetratricopeptide repeat protein [Candidatus Babela massiliensis]CDK30861.1 TPR repeats containing protein [Candidatus Babela massiliensis]
MVKKHLLALLLFNLVFYNYAIISNNNIASEESWDICNKGTEFYGNNDFENAEKFWLLAAEKGCEYAEYHLGMLYLFKKVDLNLAKNYFLGVIEKIATGNKDLKAAAQVALSTLYLKENNLKEAKKYALESIKNQCYEGYHNLGIVYQWKNKIQKAKEYYLLASANNILAANYHLGLIYEDESDLEKAKKIYELAAEQGYELAQHNLAFLYEKEKDIEKAKYYYTLAADQNLIESQISLARIYYYENNLEKAKYYLSIGVNQGNEEAKRLLDIISK